MQKGIIICFITVAVGLLIGCSKVPGHIINPEKMESLLIDIHKAEAYMESKKEIAYNKDAQDSIKSSIYTRHNVTSQDFDSSLVWYGANLDIFIEIYNNIIIKLQEEDNALLALMNNQKDMYVGMTRSGDTVNIWNLNSHYLFEGKLNNNLLSFAVPYDDNFKENDIFKLKFKLSSKDESPYNPQVILAVKQDKDSTDYVRKSVNKIGWDSVEIRTKGVIKRVMGSIYIPAVPEWKVTHVDSISLERIHTVK